ncbi:hypothetical protein ASTA108788_13185 [Asticcacaulis taihuensis]|uniref:PIN domain-containing protein n=2 Tax=Asticcacaulis taihuensis TaxID=260084 RepID=A0A1G4RDQ4_9CAUL|nr:hypothetical protein SAMN02927928_1808 [Asticcacaulis taihuensis]
MGIEMKQAVCIDCCAWNYFFDRGLDLSVELPKERFSIFMPREVEIEIAAIPDTSKNGTDNIPLKAYIYKTIHANQIQTTSVFGFATLEPDGTPSSVQTYGGFGQGTFQSDKGRGWYASQDVQSMLNGNSKRPTGLTRNQADAAVASHSFYSIVLTAEDRDKKGPIKLAANKNGKIIYLKVFGDSGLSLKNYISENIF